MGKIIGTLVTVFLLWLIVWVPIFGLHKNTGEGSHVGYITATERSGVFFKTMTAYVKTDTQSSQEDSYCVLDPKVYSDLEIAAESKEKVKVNFFSWFLAGISNCNAEGQIVSSVERL